MKFRGQHPHSSKYRVSRTVLSEKKNLFCPECGSGRLRQGRIEDTKVICSDCNHVFVYEKKGGVSL